MTRLTPGILAVVVGLVLAVVVFVPFVAVSYRRRGGVTPWRSIGWLALLLSFLALWTYTILPAPAPTDDYRCTTPNLDILRDLKDIVALQQGGGSLLANAALQVAVLNVVFFVPIGFLLRTMFRRGVVVAAVAGFLLSLAVETTQLTGLWGLYPCSYRLFSVGDLLHNTVGAVLGSLLALLVVRRRVAASPSHAPRPVTAGRRILGVVCDVVLVGVVSMLGGLVVALLTGGRSATDGLEGAIGTAAGLAAYVLPVLVTGRTPGEAAVLLRPSAGRRPVLLARAVRAATGLAGVIVLSEAVPVVGDAAALALALANLVLVFTTRGHRGLPLAAAGMTLADARSAPLPATTRA